MPNSNNSEPIDQQLQKLDVHIVDILSHLEALLRHSHSIQRALLKLRAEAPPPMPSPTENTLVELTTHAHEMRRDCDMLEAIVDDLIVGIEGLPVAKA